MSNNSIIHTTNKQQFLTQNNIFKTTNTNIISEHVIYNTYHIIAKHLLVKALTINKFSAQERNVETWQRCMIKVRTTNKQKNDSKAFISVGRGWYNDSVSKIQADVRCQTLLLESHSFACYYCNYYTKTFIMAFKKKSLTSWLYTERQKSMKGEINQVHAWSGHTDKHLLTFTLRKWQHECNEKESYKI